MKKLTFIITGLSTGGAEHMLLKLLQRIDRGQFAIEVVSLTTRGEIAARLEALDIPVLALGMRRGWPSPLAMLRLVSHLRRTQPDVVQTWMYHADLLGGVAARLAGVRCILWGIRHSNLEAEQNRGSTLWVVKQLARLSRWLPRAIVSCSERARAVHVEAGYAADKMVVIPNGFDLTQFAPDPQARASVRAELGLPADAPIVGVIARDHPQKNQIGFLEAAAVVRAAMPHTRFVLAGTGIDDGNARLRAAITARGLQECVRLLGPRNDVPRLMAALDVLASPSLGEAFPNVLGEAMACGVPCVVTDVGDSAEIVGHTGRVVASHDMAGLGRHLVEVLSLPSEQRPAMAAETRTRICERYEIGGIVRRYERLYQDL